MLNCQLSNGNPKEPVARKAMGNFTCKYPMDVSSGRSTLARCTISSSMLWALLVQTLSGESRSGTPVPVKKTLGDAQSHLKKKCGSEVVATYLSPCVDMSSRGSLLRHPTEKNATEQDRVIQARRASAISKAKTVHLSWRGSGIILSSMLSQPKHEELSALETWPCGQALQMLLPSGAYVPAGHPSQVKEFRAICPALH